MHICNWAFQVGRGKESACQCRRHKRRGFDLWAGRSLGGEHDNPLQYSCLENRMDRGTWWAKVHRVEKSCEVTTQVRISYLIFAFDHLSIQVTYEHLVSIRH